MRRYERLSNSPAEMHQEHNEVLTVVDVVAEEVVEEAEVVVWSSFSGRSTRGTEN